MENNENERGSTTLYDVAREAGVSPMTVSRVINGRNHVSPTTRAKVLLVMERMNYQVNVAARAARIGALRVGLLYSNPSAAFQSAFLAGATAQCSLNGAELVMAHCEDMGSQRATIDKLIALGVDGVLVPPPLCDSPPALKHLEQLAMPFVAVATARPASSVSAVRIDDYAGARTMTEYLISLGHTDIGFIKGDPEHTPAQLRYKAFRDVMEEAKLPVSVDRIAHGMFTYRSGLMAARELLSQPTRPTAIFASNDDMAAAAVAVAHGLHLHLPDDLAICGFDDTPVATTVWPELTTIRQPISDLARNAVDMVLEQIRERRAGRAPQPQHRLMPYTLEVRDSTGPLG
ncbi:MAG: LacI family DNA-binding transcriptional regulator [Massilia sp.]